MEGLCSECLIREHKDWIQEGYCTLALVRNSDQTVKNRPLEISRIIMFIQKAWRLDTRGLLHVGSGQKFWPEMFLKASGNRVLSEIASRSSLDLFKRFILLPMPQIDKEVPQKELSPKPFLSYAQLLLILFGTSDRYQNKCTEVGHNGDNQQRNNGKYRGNES